MRRKQEGQLSSRHTILLGCCLAQSSDPSWIADIPRSNLVGLRRPVVTARASDTHGPTATFPKLPMQKNLVGGLLIAKYG